MSILTIQQSFEHFHHTHPEVYDYLVGLAHKLINRGYTHYGIGSLYEHARWHFEFEQKEHEEFKLNNNYRSRYARLIMEQEPELRTFFELRHLKAA